MSKKKTIAVVYQDIGGGFRWQLVVGGERTVDVGDYETLEEATETAKNETKNVTVLPNPTTAGGATEAVR